METKIKEAGELEEAFIFDLDGVLADNSPRQGILRRSGDTKPSSQDWEDFFKASELDGIYPDTVRLFASLKERGYKCLIVTGRHEKYHHLTLPWLEKNGIICDGIYARKGPDFRKDFEFKSEVYTTHIRPYYKVLGVFEDRADCVKMWRSFGLTCYQPREASY